MSCPDRFTLFAGVEEGAPGLREHLASCERCARIADEERGLARALERLRDPAPPGDLLQGIWQRVEEAAALHARLRRQAVAAVSLATLLVGGLLAAFWRDLVIDAAVDAVVLASQVGTALGAVGRSLGSRMEPLAVSVVTAQALALVLAALMFHRLLAGSRLRS